MDWDLQCENCGVHYTLSPGNNLDGAVTNGMACPECGGKRFFRNQPNPVQNEGTMRDMVDSDSQIDQGGNPLGEGTIMGDDGERPLGKRDNFMHSHRTAEEFDPQSEISEIDRLKAQYQHWLHEDPDAAREIFYEIQKLQNAQAMRSEHNVPGESPVSEEDFMPPSQRRVQIDPEQDAQQGDLTIPPHWGHKSIAMDRSLDMEPYEMDGLFDLPSSYRNLPHRQAGSLWNTIKGVGEQAINFAPGAAELAAGTAGDFIPGVDFGPSEALQAAGAGTLAEEAGQTAAQDVGKSVVQKGLDLAKSKGVSTLKNQATNQIKQHLPGGGVSGLMKGALGIGAGGVGGAGLAGSMGGGAAGSPVPTDPGWQTTVPGPWYGSTDLPMFLLADAAHLETSDSIKSLGEQNGDDPEKVDQKEFNDRDHSPSNHQNPNNEDSGSSGEDGVRQKSEGYGFGPNSPGIDRAMMLLPLILHYYQSEESGENDPLIKGLHDMLEQENPGYLQQQHPEGNKIVQEIIQLHKPHPGEEEQQHAEHTGGINMAPGGMVPEKWPSPSGAPQPNQVGARCPNCGGVTNPDGSCPQCGTTAQQPGLPSTPSRMANTVGPQTPEQKSVVIQYLVDHGRGDEAPNVDLHPEQYARELAEITQRPNVPPMPDPSQVTPLVPQPSQPGGMPVPDPGAAAGPASGAPMQPMSSIHESIMAPGSPGLTDPLRGRVDSTTMAIMQNLMKRNPELAEDEALNRAMEWSRGMDPAGWDVNHGDAHATPRTNRDYPGVASDAAYNLDNPLNRYKVPEVPEGMQLPPQHNDPFLSHIEALVLPIDELYKQAADSVAPRCPKCNSGSTTTRSGTEGISFECNACHNIFERDDVDTNKYKGASVKQTADSVAPRCPFCHSGTTTTRSGSEGISFECNSCHKIFKRDDVDTNKYKGASLQIQGLIDVPNPNLNRDDSALAWKDTTGKDLMENQEYEITSAAFNAPTYATVLRVHPNHLDMKVSGGIMASLNPDENAPDFQIKRKEAQLDDYQFTPVNNPQKDMDDHNTEPPTGTTPGEAHVPPSGPTTDEMASSFPNTTVSSIDEDEEDESEPDHCVKCGATMLDHNMRDEVTTLHQCVPCGHAWETKDDFQGREAGVDLSWLMTDGGEGDDFWSGYERVQAMHESGTQSRNISDVVASDERYQAIHERLQANAMQREAGKHFTPAEKRALINERGRARNLEDLDLSNTHYEVRDDDKANGLNVREDDLFLGI